MKKILNFFMSLMLLLTLIVGLFPQTTQARTYGVTDTRTFILDKGNDLGAIIPKGYYYIPRIPFNEYKKVQQRFLSKLNYPGDFYSKRNITPDLVKGKSKYFVIQWNKPFYVTNLNAIKRVLSGYLFAYRKNGDVFWMDAKNFTPAFLTGYKKKENQSIVIYPIRDRRNGQIKAFIQYPCGNLVCKDTLCTDLRVTPTCGDGVLNPEIGEQCDFNDPKTKNGCLKNCTYKSLSCEITPEKKEILNVESPRVKIKTTDSKIKISKVYLNRQTYNNVNQINSKRLEPGIYTLNAVAINPYTGKEFLCDSSTFRVKAREYCGDGIVNGKEECDFKDPNNNGACTTSCKFIGESCSVIVKKIRLDEPTPFLQNVGLRKSNKTVVEEVTVNGKKIDFKTYKFDKNGEYKVQVKVKNPYSKKEAICSNVVYYKKKEYCGDGIVNGYEQCDDGNNENYDGCSQYCKYEQPICQISKKTNLFLEGQPYYQFVKLRYRGKFDNGNINRTDFYDNYKDLLLAKVKAKNKCNNNGTLEYTVYNPINKDIKKTCQVAYTVKRKASCGDGIVNGNELCDPEDHYSGPFCNSDCTIKKPEKCDIISNTFDEGKKGILMIDIDYYARIDKLELNGRTIRTNGGSAIQLNGLPAGRYNARAYISSLYTPMRGSQTYRATKVCDIAIIVQPDECKEDTGSDDGISELNDILR